MNKLLFALPYFLGILEDIRKTKVKLANKSPSKVVTDITDRGLSEAGY
jgi:hypothetical protein